MLLMHDARRAASRADCTAGSNSAIKTAMIAMTTSSSISVNPRRRIERALQDVRKKEDEITLRCLPQHVGERVPSKWRNDRLSPGGTEKDAAPRLTTRTAPCNQEVRFSNPKEFVDVDDC